MKAVTNSTSPILSSGVHIARLACSIATQTVEFDVVPPIRAFRNLRLGEAPRHLLNQISEINIDSTLTRGTHRSDISTEHDDSL